MRLYSLVVHQRNNLISYRNVNRTTIITLDVAKDLSRAVRLCQKNSGSSSVKVIMLASVKMYKEAKSTSTPVSDRPAAQHQPWHIFYSSQNKRPGIEKSSVWVEEK